MNWPHITDSVELPDEYRGYSDAALQRLNTHFSEPKTDADLNEICAFLIDEIAALETVLEHRQKWHWIYADNESMPEQAAMATYRTLLNRISEL